MALLPISAVPAAAVVPTSDLIITGVFDGPLPGGIPKGVELFAVNAIPDLSIYGIGSANNGPTDGEEFSFPADSAAAGEFIYVAYEGSLSEFTTFFGFAPNYIDGAANINGDDPIEMFMNGSVADVFGEVGTDGTGQPWEHLDGWAYRVSGTGPDGSTFVLANWTFSGINQLEGGLTNATCTVPFPIGTYTVTNGTPEPVLIINEVDADQAGTDAAEFVELYDGGFGGTDLTGTVLVFFNGSDDASYEAFDLDTYSTDVDGYFVLCANIATVPACDLDVSPDTNLIQNGADAVALFTGDAVDFPEDTPVTTTNLLDAIVYGTDDGDDVGLLPLLNPGQPQVDEGTWPQRELDSNQRCPNGSGGQRNTDTYTQLFPTAGAENTCVPPPAAVFIHDVQGPGAVTPIPGTVVIIEGVVVGDFQDTDLNGFFLQEEDTDADLDPLTSEGVFVYEGALDVPVAMGDTVKVTGTAVEYYDFTQISSVSSIEVTGSGATATPVPLVFPVAVPDAFEPIEGMGVVIPLPMVITEYYNFDRYGEITLGTSRLQQPTAVFEPGSLAAATIAAVNARSIITLDDGYTGQNMDPARHPNGGVFDLTNRFRGGDVVTDVVGVMHDSFGYRIHPTAGATYTAVNPRPAAPADVGGGVTVAAFNVLNYFTTLDGSGPICGPNPDYCRGADDAEEFTRQRTKIIAAIAQIDADVVGLMEIENNVDASLIDLVGGLNDLLGAGTYDYVDAGYVGPDVIKVGLIYKPGTVSLDGAHAILDDPGFLDPNATGDNRNRAALAQTFMENATGESFVVAVNHFKSKGSACGAGDDDPETGSCNLTRTMAAGVLTDWLAGDPTGSGDPDILVIGDLNSYDKEDPIDAMKAGADDALGTGDDYHDLIHEFMGESAYSYVYSAQWGYLDYAMANVALRGTVTGTTVWHINADEPDILDYDTQYKQDAQDLLYEPNAYRSSDHDPVIVGLDLTLSDSDGDGIPNVADNCPAVSNQHQNDFDGDGMGNRCDPDDDNDGVPDVDDPLPWNPSKPDVDGDGVVNTSDNCPSVANARQKDFDKDGMGNRCDLDDDNDGILDTHDIAPWNPNKP